MRGGNVMEVNSYEVLENLSLAILKRIGNDSLIRDEQVVGFWKETYHVVRDGQLNLLGSSFFDLKNLLEKYYGYGWIEKMNPNQAVLMGALWSATKIIDVGLNEKKENEELISDAGRLVKTKLVWEVMRENKRKGIELRELAKRCEIGNDELRMLFSGLINKRYFSFSKYGKEVYYFLEERGDKLLELMNQ